MRTFSALKALCAHPELLRRPSKRRDDAAELGTSFHRYIEEWAKALAAGKTWHTDGAPEPIRGWLRRMRQAWTPPPGLEVEVAMGLAVGDDGEPLYTPVREPKPHAYVKDGACPTDRPLLTAGRADLVEVDGGSLVHVDDIKTGQFYLGDPKKLRQLLAQGIAATLRADADGFVPGIYYARLGMFDRGDGEVIWRRSHEWDQAWAWVVEAAQMPATPQPGPWCLSCWEKAECSANPAREAA